MQAFYSQSALYSAFFEPSEEIRGSIDRLVRRHLRRAPRRVLDPAGGPGLWLEHFQRAGAEVAGCDLEERAIAGLLERYRGTRWLDVDLYQVGHHGSANGTTRALVAAMTPHVALIAMGPESRHLPWTAWTYGHPRADVVRRLERGVTMLRANTTVPIASGAKKFASHGLEKAIDGTGWDGAVSVDMGADDSIAIHVPDTVGVAGDATASLSAAE